MCCLGSIQALEYWHDDARARREGLQRRARREPASAAAALCILSAKAGSRADFVLFRGSVIVSPPSWLMVANPVA